MSDVFETIIDAATLHARIDDEDTIVVDARFNLMKVDEGRAAYLDAHIPGAVYVHLDEDLSGPPLTDAGRHPLPSPEALTALFSRLGVRRGAQVIAYDGRDGMLAARVWWLLRYMGHTAVAVLDGGFEAWRAAGYPTASGEERRAPGTFEGRARREWLVTLDEVPGAALLVDARDPRRYRGEHEPLDAVAGHIPGAVNHFYADNLDGDGHFLPPETLAQKFSATLADTPPGEAVYYCGSGVTACHDLLAAHHAGLAPGRLYAGSWSEWCSDPARPVATGAAPGGMAED